MNKIIAMVLAATMLPLAAASYAADMKIGFVNTERVFREAAPAMKAQKKLEKEFAPRELELQKMAKQAKEMQTHLERDGMTISESERRNKERDLANLNRDFQRSQREFREDLNLRRNEELSAVHDRARKTIMEIAEKEKFDLVLEEAVYFSPRIDITDKVLKALADK
ncbi:MAG TPA: OmpH family outer membrane protein [Sulfuricella sp.]|nr:OmpH family outer membrane protein [Sulfuricella sp.]